MNYPASPLRRRLVAAVALFLGAACGSRAEIPNADELVPLPSNAGVYRGMLREEVAMRLGEPGEKLSANVWLYWDFHAAGRPAGKRWDALVVYFVNGRVSLLRLTERKAVLALQHPLRPRGAPGAATIAPVAP